MFWSGDQWEKWVGMWAEVGDGMNVCANEQAFITEEGSEIWAGRHFISNALKGRGRCCPPHVSMHLGRCDRRRSRCENTRQTPSFEPLCGCAPFSLRQIWTISCSFTFFACRSSLQVSYLCLYTALSSCGISRLKCACPLFHLHHPAPSSHHLFAVM